MAPLKINTVGTTGEGGRLLVLLHGYGADEHDLAPIAELVDTEGRFLAVCPRAPIDIVPFGAGWYERDASGAIDPAQFLASVDAVDATIDAVCAENGFDRGNAVVVGFSQGGAMALAASLRVGAPTRPAAVACLSGMMQEVDGLEYAFDDLLPRILIQHGTWDPLVTIERGHQTRDALIAHRVEHQYLEYPMQHEITGESVMDLRTWLADV